MAVFATLETGLATGATTSTLWSHWILNSRASSCPHDCVGVRSTISLPSTTWKEFCPCNFPSTQIYVACTVLESLALYPVIHKFHRKSWWWHQGVRVNISCFLLLPSCFGSWVSNILQVNCCKHYSFHRSCFIDKGGYTFYSSDKTQVGLSLLCFGSVMLPAAYSIIHLRKKIRLKT